MLKIPKIPKIPEIPEIPRGPDRQRGFTLIEMAIAVAVIAAVAGGLLTWKETAMREAVASRTAEGIVLIQEALYSYRLNPAHGYAWPAAIADLEPYLPNFAGGGSNGVGQPYHLAPPASASTSAGIEIRTDMLTARAATDVARLFPLNGAASGATVSVGVPVPGHEAAREAVLARDGSKAMQGSLDMAGHDITSLGGLGAASIAVDTLSVNDARMSIGNQSISDDAVRFLNQLASLDCTAGQRVRVAAGAPACLAVSAGGPGADPDGPGGNPGNPGDPDEPGDGNGESCPAGWDFHAGGLPMHWVCNAGYPITGGYCGYRCAWQHPGGK